MKKTNYPLPVILRDSREQKGFSFRKSDNCAGMIVEKLDFGDYAIQEHLDLIIIERKKSICELCTNFGKKRKQFIAEFDRMVEANCKFRYVVIEDYWSSISKQKYNRWKPDAILANIHSFELKYSLHFICAGNASMAQKLTRSLLIRAYQYRMEGLV
jgi:ERCC4-type nuclease